MCFSWWHAVMRKKTWNFVFVFLKVKTSQVNIWQWQSLKKTGAGCYSVFFSSWINFWNFFFHFTRSRTKTNHIRWNVCPIYLPIQKKKILASSSSSMMMIIFSGDQINKIFVCLPFIHSFKIITEWDGKMSKKMEKNRKISREKNFFFQINVFVQCWRSSNRFFFLFFFDSTQESHKCTNK